MADECQILRVYAIVLESIGLTPSQAINTYLKLKPVLSIGPPKDDKECERNSEAFEASFREVILDAVSRQTFRW
jgi:hypothetical protein